jgi:hypothetical protein
MDAISRTLIHQNPIATGWPMPRNFAPQLRHLATILPTLCWSVIGQVDDVRRVAVTTRSVMKLRLDLLLPAILVASAGGEFVAQDRLSLSPPAARSCQLDSATPADAAQRILAEGYTEIRALSKGCDNVWRARAFAEGDPVSLLVTPQGAVLTE